MKAATMQLISSSEGEFNHYSQGGYIKENNWGHTDSAQRQGAWVGNTKDSKGRVVEYGLSGGVCRGLSAAYLIAGNHWDNFKAYVNGPEGKALVRGIMNIQNEIARCGNEEGISEAFAGFLKIHHVNFIQFKYIPQSISSTNFGREILKNTLPGFGYHITLLGPWGGHSLAMRVESGNIKFFDPEYGEVSYPYSMCSSPAMASFLDHLLYEYYPPVNDVYIEHYTLR